jgi:hypothetical protein
MRGVALRFHPLFVLRAGREAFPGVTAAMDQFAAKALARNLPVTFVNHATGPHGADMDDDTDATRKIIRQVLAFLQLHLED